MKLTRFALVAAMAAPVLATPITPDALDGWRTGWMTPGSSGGDNGWSRSWNSGLRPELFGAGEPFFGAGLQSPGSHGAAPGILTASGDRWPAYALWTGGYGSVPTSLMTLPGGGSGGLDSSFRPNALLYWRPAPFSDAPAPGGITHKMMIPEPMMIVLFGLTGLFLLKRRCR